MSFWPDTDTPRSTYTGFTRGLSDDPDAWRSFYRLGRQSEAQTAVIDRIRASGTDRQTLHVMPKKEKKPPMSRLMREAMVSGPKSAVELGAAANTASRNVGECLRYAIRNGEVVKLGPRPFRYALAGGL